MSHMCVIHPTGWARFRARDLEGQPHAASCAAGSRWAGCPACGWLRPLRRQAGQHHVGMSTWHPSSWRPTKGMPTRRSRPRWTRGRSGPSCWSCWVPPSKAMRRLGTRAQRRWCALHRGRAGRGGLCAHAQPPGGRPTYALRGWMCSRRQPSRICWPMRHFWPTCTL